MNDNKKQGASSRGPLVGLLITAVLVVVGWWLARELTGAFLHAVFSGAERHLRRLAEVKALEERFGD